MRRPGANVMRPDMSRGGQLWKKLVYYVPGFSTRKQHYEDSCVRLTLMCRFGGWGGCDMIWEEYVGQADVICDVCCAQLHNLILEE